MIKYKRLKSLRMYIPLVIGITIGSIQNFIIGIILALIWIMIDIFFIEPKLPRGRRRQEGEVFIIEPTKNNFLFAKIVRTKVPNNDPIMNGGHLVYIYNQSGNPLEIPTYLDTKNLAIPPQIIDDKGWNQGNFQTVGVQEVTDQERELEYGFWDIKTNKFVDEEGKELSQPPAIYSDFGVSSYGSVADELRSILDISYPS